jgi:carbamoyl-phosphate synthase large subunit
MLMKSLKVLITAAGTVTCQSIIKGFRQQQEVDVCITTVDASPMSAGRYFADRFYLIPSAPDPAYLPTLLEIVEREHIQLLIPILDEEFMKLAEGRAQFERRGCRVVISSPQTVATCNQKDKTSQFFLANGIATPQAWRADELPEVDRIPYPIFVKPRTNGRGSVGVHKICNAAEFLVWKDRVEDPIYNEFVEGEEYTIDVLTDFEGRVLAVLPRRRVEVKAGVSYKGLTVRDPEMIRMGKLIAEKAGILGPANIQCFKTPRGLIFFEINARFSGTLAFSIAAGLNSPLLLAKCALGEKVERRIDDFEDGLMMLRFWDEIFVRNGDKPRRVAIPLGEQGR